MRPRTKKYKIMFCIAATILMTVSCSTNVRAEEIDTSDYDFEGIDDVLEKSDYSGESFSDMVEKLLSGQSEGVFIDIFKLAGDKLFGEINYNKQAIVRVVLLAIAAALLSKLSVMFVNSKMSDTGILSGSGGRKRRNCCHGPV